MGAGGPVAEPRHPIPPPWCASRRDRPRPDRPRPDRPRPDRPRPGPPETRTARDPDRPRPGRPAAFTANALDPRARGGPTWLPALPHVVGCTAAAAGRCTATGCSPLTGEPPRTGHGFGVAPCAWWSRRSTASAEAATGTDHPGPGCGPAHRRDSGRPGRCPSLNGPADRPPRTSQTSARMTPFRLGDNATTLRCCDLPPAPEACQPLSPCRSRDGACARLCPATRAPRRVAIIGGDRTRPAALGRTVEVCGWRAPQWCPTRGGL